MDYAAYQMIRAAQVLIQDGALTEAVIDQGGDAFPKLLEKTGLTDLLRDVTMGGRIHMERSPGNYAFTREGDKTYICLYDSIGAEIRVSLPPAAKAGSPGVPEFSEEIR